MIKIEYARISREFVAAWIFIHKIKKEDLTLVKTSKTEDTLPLNHIILFVSDLFKYSYSMKIQVKWETVITMYCNDVS